MAERKFKIIEINEVTTKTGNKFNAFKTLATGARKMDVRFTRECKNIPVAPCVIVCDENDCNVDTTRQYPILWIKNVIRIEEFERRNNVSDFFKDDEE